MVKFIPAGIVLGGLLLAYSLWDRISEWWYAEIGFPLYGPSPIYLLMYCFLLYGVVAFFLLRNALKAGEFKGDEELVFHLLNAFELLVLFIYFSSYLPPTTEALGVQAEGIYLVLGPWTIGLGEAAPWIMAVVFFVCLVILLVTELSLAQDSLLTGIMTGSIALYLIVYQSSTVFKIQTFLRNTRFP